MKFFHFEITEKKIAFIKLKKYISKIILPLRRFLIRHGSNFGYFSSRNRLDKRIAEFFSYKRNGIFIEAGAADGFLESNTLSLEKKYGWTGLLIEPNPEQFDYCKKFRNKNIVENFFLTDSSNTSPITKMRDARRSSRKVEHNLVSSSAYNQENKKIINETKQNTFFAKNASLQSLLEKHHINHVDIMILDVEGDVMEVLDGYDHNSKIIDFLLIEIWKEDLLLFLQKSKEKNWEHIDHWNGSDYLFKL